MRGGNNNNRGGGGGGSGGGGPRGGGGVGGGGRSRGGGRNGPRSTSNLPLEQGVICTLKDSFGFIHCADRPEEIFFHYSSVVSPHPDELQLDEEVEFRVGSSARDADKLAAYEVKRLPPNVKIEWEKEEGEQGQRYQGIVEKIVRDDRRSPTPVPGAIRILVPEQDDQGKLASTDDKQEAAAAVLKAEGPLVKYSLQDFITEDSSNDANWNRASTFRTSSNGPHALSKGDYIECRMFRDRRTKELWAREIRLLQSEKERARLEAEQQMLSNATLEHGVITRLKGEYGFLRSNKRREEVFFHLSNLHVDDDSDADKEAKEDLVLKEGQDMQFLVVTEEGEDNGAGSGPSSLKRRVSARQIKLQPRGSVQFHDTVAQGAVGRLLIPPQPVDSTHTLESHGRIRLMNPIVVQDDEGNDKLVEEIFLSSKDSPGGSFSFRGGSSLGMWVQEGDKLLFDVVKDFVDGSCHAKPTRYLTPNPKPLELLMGCTEYPDLDLCSDGEEAVRLIDLAYAMRADGLVNAVKESYGFLHFSERPVDVHFKLFQVLPDHIQIDLRRNMGFAEPSKPLRLHVGAEASFDLSVHGTIHIGAPQNGGGRSRKNQHDRENLKAQRILFLPKGSVKLSYTLASGVEAVVVKEDANQAYSGIVELDTPIQPMTLDQRHPFVAKAIDDFLESGYTKQLIFHDVQTQTEDDIVMEMINLKANGKIACSYLPQPGETEHKGRLCLRKVDPDEIVDKDIGDDKTEPDSTSGDEIAKQKRPKKKTKEKPTKSLHFDKGCLSPDLRKEEPPAAGDRVKVDIVQSRKTGVIAVANMTMVSRHTPEITESADEGMGLVTEIVPKRKFGFISLQDESASKRELLFFHLSSVVATSEGGKKDSPAVRKGDEVKFNIGSEKNGKRVALNVSILPKGSLPTKSDKNACTGLVLLEPSHTTLRNTPLRHTSSTASSASGASQSNRWEIGSDKEVSKEQFAEEGRILLISDPADMFSSQSDGNNGNADRESKASSDDNATAGSPVLHYKNGALALHGGSLFNDERSQPKRGDLITFVKGKNRRVVRDIRVAKREEATLLRGHLEEIKISQDSDSEGVKSGTARFIASTPGDEIYKIDLQHVVSCDVNVLKEKEEVEAVLHEGKLYGICRVSDLYLGSKARSNQKERRKLNLTVKKDRGGTIIAQSMMAKGPDGTRGFASGWTSRISRYSLHPDEGASPSEP